MGLILSCELLLKVDNISLSGVREMWPKENWAERSVGEMSES